MGLHTSTTDNPCHLSQIYVPLEVAPILHIAALAAGGTLLLSSVLFFAFWQRARAASKRQARQLFGSYAGGLVRSYPARGFPSC